MHCVNSYLKNQKRLLEDSIRDINNPSTDFISLYFAVGYLQTIAEKDPEIMTIGVIETLGELLQDRRYEKERRGFFLYRLAADTLKALIVRSHHMYLGKEAYKNLIYTLNETSGYAHQVSAEALGALPLDIRSPENKEVIQSHVPCLQWSELFGKTGLKIASSLSFMGRSLVAKLDSECDILVLKFSRLHEIPAALLGEVHWMEHIRDITETMSCRFDIPKPLKIHGKYLFKLVDPPFQPPENLRLHPELYAILFLAHEDYYRYPNHTLQGVSLESNMFLEMIDRNAWILGRLTSLGIIHTAPIPLFHNRVERHRRRDYGLYQWFRAGRLDRWLESCFYPNVGLTGPRDFEHFIPFRGPERQLYRYIGTHLLSLILVCGSYFRNKDRTRIGIDEMGRPFDTRDLFHDDLLKEMVLRLFQGYYHGFVGEAYEDHLPFDLHHLTDRLIDELGVDNHMEEMVRVADQNAMTDAAFRDFLMERGYTEEAITQCKKGEQDLVIQTGPHLGAFNNRISLPELIEAVAAMSALCISGRYWKQESRMAVGSRSL
jgi:hypothetical protein